MIFGIKEKSIILTHTMYICIATNIPVLLMTGFVVQGHIYLFEIFIYLFIFVKNVSASVLIKLSVFILW